MSGKWKQCGLVLSGVCLGVLISLQMSAYAQHDVSSSLPVEDMRNLSEVFNKIKKNYVEPTNDKKLIENAIGGMVSGLDPHSSYLDADSLKDLEVSTKGEFGGLGLEVGMEDGFVKIISPIEDTPAFKAGIKSGDLIIKLDDTMVKGLSLNDAVSRMRGKPGTSITLTILRKGDNKPLEIKITRQIIKVQSVKSKYIDGFAYVRITQFQEASTVDLAKHLEELYKKGPVKGIVLDLRNDPGGLLTSAIGVSAAFLPSNTLVVYTDGRTEDSRQKYYATPENYQRRGTDILKNLPADVKKAPMVVLVNGGSASASEIVAGALQDEKRATIMGTQTFGKGSVQTILPLSATTAVKLTTARYYTPSGRSIQAKGITPDLLVDETPEGSNGRWLREADLEHHLANDKDPSAGVPASAPKEKPVAESSKADEKDEAKKQEPRAPIEFGSKDDFQLQQAINHLKGLPVLVQKTKADASAPVAKKDENSDKDEPAKK